MILRHRLSGQKGGDDALQAQAASDLVVSALPATATEEAEDGVASRGLASAAVDFIDGYRGLVVEDAVEDERMGAPQEGADGAGEPGDAAAVDEATPPFWTELHTAINRQDWGSVLRFFSIAHHTVVSSVFCGWRRG